LSPVKIHIGYTLSKLWLWFAKEQ